MSHVSLSIKTLLYKLTKALAFLPPKHVLYGFKQIQAISNLDFKPILDYFEEYYIGTVLKYILIFCSVGSRLDFEKSIQKST